MIEDKLPILHEVIKKNIIQNIYFIESKRKKYKHRRK